MHNQKRIQQKEAWAYRQLKYGNSRRSVLFKGLPDFLNNRIHNLHTKFIVEHMPEGAKTLLDVGSGYGRISGEIRKKFKTMTLEGVELCPAYVEHYRENFGDCFEGLASEYHSEKKFDVIVMVTILMYQEHDKMGEFLSKYWGLLKSGGCLICIEPFDNVMIKYKRIKSKIKKNKKLDEYYFSKSEICDLITALPGNRLVADEIFGMLPAINRPILHYGVVAIKD